MAAGVHPKQEVSGESSLLSSRPEVPPSVLPQIGAETVVAAWTPMIKG